MWKFPEFKLFWPSCIRESCSPSVKVKYWRGWMVAWCKGCFVMPYVFHGCRYVWHENATEEHLQMLPFLSGPLKVAPTLEIFLKRPNTCEGQGWAFMASYRPSSASSFSFPANLRHRQWQDGQPQRGKPSAHKASTAARAASAHLQRHHRPACKIFIGSIPRDAWTPFWACQHGCKLTLPVSDIRLRSWIVSKEAIEWPLQSSEVWSIACWVETVAWCTAVMGSHLALFITMLLSLPGLVAVKEIIF